MVLVLCLATASFRTELRAQTKPSADQRIIPYATAKPVLDAFARELPPELKGANEARWNAWAQREDKAVRARLQRGALDSMVNLLLFGTSFTAQPRFPVAEDAQPVVLQSRIADLLRGLRNPGENERLIFLRRLLRDNGMNPDTSSGRDRTKAFILENLHRVEQEQVTFAERFDDASRQNDRSAGLLELSRMYSDRGISIDTTILSSFSIDEALRDMKRHGVLGEGQIGRVAVIGPGLDFTDKKGGYDFYPEQSLQPFAIYESLIRSGLAHAGTVALTAFDISPEVLDHLRRARGRAAAGGSYTVQLPRGDPSWTPRAVEYWRSFGLVTGAEVTPIAPPQVLKGLAVRAVRVRPEIVLSCRPVDRNVVFEPFDLPAKDRYDLVIATNVFIYYDGFEQALALQNVATALKPGGFLLTTELLPQSPAIAMRLVAHTPIRYSTVDGYNIFWWERH